MCDSCGKEDCIVLGCKHNAGEFVSSHRCGLYGGVSNCDDYKALKRQLPRNTYDDEDALQRACEYLANCPNSNCPASGCDATWVCDEIGAVVYDDGCTMEDEQEECWIWYFKTKRKEGEQCPS